MTEEMKKCLLGKNQKLIDMVIEKAKRDFPEDIAIVGLTGSFSTGDFHEKSDLDLIIINNTQRGWEISKSFIYDDVGYDIYCTPWETRIEEEANLESPGVSSLEAISSGRGNFWQNRLVKAAFTGEKRVLSLPNRALPR